MSETKAKGGRPRKPRAAPIKDLIGKYLELKRAHWAAETEIRKLTSKISKRYEEISPYQPGDRVSIHFTKDGKERECEIWKIDLGYWGFDPVSNGFNPPEYWYRVFKIYRGKPTTEVYNVSERRIIRRLPKPKEKK